MVANSITGCVPLLELAYGWTILHDPAARVVFACRHHMGSGACRAQFHQFPRVCAGPAYRYGRRLFGRRSAGQAFDACDGWAAPADRLGLREVLGPMPY